MHLFLQKCSVRCFCGFDRSFSKGELLYISIGCSSVGNDLSERVHTFSEGASLAEHMTWSISPVDTEHCSLFHSFPLAAIMQMTLPPEKRTRKGVPQGLISHSESSRGAGRVVMWRGSERRPLTADRRGGGPLFTLSAHLSNHRWALWETIQGRSSIRRVRTRGKCHSPDMDNPSPQRPLTTGRY